MSSPKIQAASLSVVSNALLVLLKLAVGLAAGSASVLSEAAHSAVDFLAAGIAYFSVRASERPADDEHPYGHGKIESVAAFIEGVLIVGAAGLIVQHAMGKLLSDS